MTISDTNNIATVAPKIVAGVLLSIVVLTGFVSTFYGNKDKKLNDKINQGKQR